MQRASGFVEVVFEPIDLLAQLVAVATIPVAVPIRALNLAPLTFKLALLPFEPFERLVAGHCAPARVQAPVMARLKTLYKSKNGDRGCRRRGAPTITR